MDVRRMGVTVTALALVFAFAVAAWSGIGNLDQLVDDLPMDYMVRPPRLSADMELALGRAARAVALIAGIALALATALGVVDVRWWLVLAPLLVAGFLAALGWRILTAGSVDANIGAPAIVLGCATGTLGLVADAAARAAMLRERGARPYGGRD